MIFSPTPLLDAMVADLKEIGDERGYFARAFCVDEFASAGILETFVQANISRCTSAGTLRGLHYQDASAPEAKFMRCIRGSVYDVMVDMRPMSETYLKWFGIELSDTNRKAVYVPPMFAHGYLSLTNDAEVLYMVSHRYAPGAEKGVHYADPAISIELPIDVEHISDKDRNWPFLSLPEHSE